jgi:hypothetical protein
MKQIAGLHVNRDRAAGFAAALVLHFIVLYGLWSYHIIPPPTEALTVFVSYINPASPQKLLNRQLRNRHRQLRKSRQHPGQLHLLHRSS